jgi:hypothetical protein
VTHYYICPPQNKATSSSRHEKKKNTETRTKDRAKQNKNKTKTKTKTKTMLNWPDPSQGLKRSAQIRESGITIPVEVLGMTWG